jgi:8-oxo-dGTP pyrophosphatase MutT (NUDIX family)
LKLTELPADDGLDHEFCIECRAETVERRVIDGRWSFHCLTCSAESNRSLFFSAAATRWLDHDNELWHESAGVFVRSASSRFLFFERLIFPFALTVPAGHIERSECPRAAAERELMEEVGLEGAALDFIATENILGDSCSAGADAHVWNVYLFELQGDIQKHRINEEGHRPVWLGLDEALESELTTPVRRLIMSYGDVLVKAGQ